MRRLFSFLKKYRREAVLAPLFKMLEASFELFVPLVVASIIDTGIRQGQREMIFRNGALLAGLAVIGLICSITAQYFSARAAVGVSADLRAALFRHLQTLSYKDLDDLGTSAMITRMTSDINQVQTGVNLALRLLLRSPFVVLGAMIMAFSVNAKAALVFVVVIPLLCVVVFSIMLFQIPMYRRVQNHLDRVVLHTRENLTGARVIRAFRQEAQQVAAYDRQTEQLHKIQLFAGRISGLMNPLTYVIINAGIIVLLRTGALQVHSGVITQGQLTALVNYMSQILVELVKMANLIISITKAVACMRRIDQVFALSSSMTYGTRTALELPDETCAVSLRGAGIRYHENADPSLSGIDLKVKAGEMVGVIGGTGAGKSTLAGLIARFYDVTEGEAALFGAPITSYTKEAVRALVGIVPQANTLFSGTIADNLRWGRADASQEELWEALRIAQADAFVREKPEGLQTMLEQEGKNLSGGQRQRLCIARTLLKRPRILILDDSTSALDFATDAGLRRALGELFPRPVIFLISQRASSIRYADQILVLEDGQCVGQGSHESLLASCKVYQEIYQAQFAGEACHDED